MGETNVMEEVGSGKFFDQMDDLLDFQNDDVEDGLFGSGEVNFDAFPPVWLEESPALSSAGGRSNSSSELSGSHRTARYEDIIQLEWLSNFFKDSLSKSKTLPICHAKRARSKRPRPATFNPRAAIQLIPPRYFPSSKKKPKVQHQILKAKKDPNTKTLIKCTHCEITETPQWRLGPQGPKTLCNACGVRYQSGRLFPEYRPAASPTFVPSLHSNSHRKVIEMRKSKIGEEISQPELLPFSNSSKKDLEIRTNKTSFMEESEITNSMSIVEVPVMIATEFRQNNDFVPRAEWA